MAENEGRFYQFDRPRTIETVMAWVIIAVVAIDFVFLGLVAWNAWKVETESRRVFATLSASSQSCRAAIESTAATRYESAPWKTSFELPPGHFANERLVSNDGDVELRVAKRPGTEDPASLNALYDTTVSVRIGHATGFSRYYSKPYTEYGGYRRFTAVGRSAIGYTDPAGAADSVQVILIDDARNDREITVTYTAVVEGAETLAFGIIDSMRLAPMEKQEVAVKPGWKIFSQDPLRFQYPEDYRVTTPFSGRVTVQGKGGRIEILSAYDLGETGRRGGTMPSNGDGGTPDEFFLLQYGVNLRVAFYYAADAAAYDRSVLKEIGATISLNQ
ncbi:MAG TPA: hypothetical protein VJ694_00535 [Patescibacteria group bacterium]|nr:hypothetical protein [Patescibacteria group bacterium]